MRRAAILQSNYIPWKGAFDIINSVDVFVFLEDVQYMTRDWRSRNIIMTKNGPLWLTVPVLNKNRRNQTIQEAVIDNSTDWQYKHFKTIETNYSKALYYKEFKWIIEDLYLNRIWTNLSELNIYATTTIAKMLNIRTEFINSADLGVDGKKDDRLIGICKKIGAEYYLSGPSAKAYINQEKFDSNGIELEYITYQYPKYKQQFEPFNHYVSVLDLIFNCGYESAFFIWGWKDGE